MRDSKDPDIKAIASKLTEEVSLSLAGNVKSGFRPIHVESESSDFDRFDDGRCFEWFLRLPKEYFRNFLCSPSYRLEVKLSCRTQTKYIWFSCCLIFQSCFFREC